ncbi:hypothetical protein UFOVP529_8 [uncultured Caudovirales phage]|uniref:Uncharacterized protein n=1 Tax=uncultured Caudovirales phage TaxID=2100421 RepID=A0A6J5R0G4_9CAUD|nr:hypothetical protein UFOVP529_8 [uncultured Caudovirales phage]CAB4190510.1 hypothetical protein UFOVP1191_66 [uncultured Caudovirales phage]CAB4194537.1 hypothetical protein UFOVP1252_112 [uncultured Caudovirales phage]
MSNLDELKAIQSEVSDTKRPARKHPEGWEPGITWNGNEGTVTTMGGPLDQAADWSAVLKVWGLDPEHFEVVEPILFNVWGNPEGVPNRQWKGKVIRKTIERGVDLQDIIEEIKKHKPGKPVVVEGSTALVVGFSDLQMGKGEGGGSAGIVDRFLAGINEVESRWKELAKTGRQLDRLVVLGLGDLVESCEGHYAMQQFQADLDRREQVKVVRRLLVKAITQWSKFAPRIIVAAVPGNHGENRQGGKAFTTFSDNDDVAVFEQVAEILAANPEAYGHVSFFFPQDELTLTLNVHGTILGLAHGHQARKGGTTAAAKIRTWWKDQAYGMQKVADATILVTGHYHHLSVLTEGIRTHIQAPSLDGGSQWFTETAGVHSAPGLLTFTVSERGWDDLRVLPCLTA